MAILDLYKAGVFKLGVDHSKAGGKTPAQTDYIKGILPQQVAVPYKGDASVGFTANLTPADRPNTQFNMVDAKTNATIKDFNPLNINNDYEYNTKQITGYNPTKLFNGGALTNPNG